MKVNYTWKTQTFNEPYFPCKHDKRLLIKKAGKAEGTKNILLLKTTMTIKRKILLLEWSRPYSTEFYS
jgi:hypothetical protein